MPAERATMRQVREVLRLKFVPGVPTRELVRRLTARTVEIFSKGELITGHMRSSGNYKHSESANTCRPVTGAMSTGTSIRIRQGAASIENFRTVRTHPGARTPSRTGLPPLPGILCVERAFGRERLEAAAAATAV
jgi:hypothetical protein